MKRLFWLGVGLTVGALVVRQVARAAQASSRTGLVDPDRAGRWTGLANTGAGWWGSVQDFIADVREGMAEREEQIHAAFARGENLADLGPDDEPEGSQRQDYGHRYDDEDGLVDARDLDDLLRQLDADDDDADPTR